MAAKTINLNEKIPAEEEIDNPVQDASDPSPTDQAQNGVTDTAPPAENNVDAAPNKEARVSQINESPVVSPTENDAIPANDIDKKMRRAERFGVPVHLTETEKRNSRAERFGIAAASNKPEAVSKPAGSNKSEAVSKPEEDLKRKARAERFGASKDSKPSLDTTEEDAKKKARLARFAPASKTDPEEDDKRKARALRFSNPPLNASHANGNKAIAGKASEGS